MKAVKVIVAGAALAIVSAFGVSVQAANATNTKTDCVDGTKRANLSVTWNSASNVSVQTVGGKKLCADTTLYFSSYTMPDNYDGKPFANNKTATPQTIFNSTHVVLKKDTNGKSTMSIKLPEACKNIQVDVYYAPEIKTVGPAGHGKQYITGKIIKKTKPTCTPVTPEEPPKPEEPEVPVPEAQNPETPAPEVKTHAPKQPEALPETGLGVAGIIATATAISAATYAGVYALNKRQ